MVGSPFPPDENREAKAYPAFREHPERKRLWTAGLVAAISAAVSNAVVFFIARHLVGIQFIVPPRPGSEDFTEIGILEVVFASVIPAFAAAALVALLIKFFKKPFLIFKIIAVVVFLFSLIGPLSLEVDRFTKAALSVMHVVAALTIVSVLLKYKNKAITHPS